MAAFVSFSQFVQSEWHVQVYKESRDGENCQENTDKLYKMSAVRSAAHFGVLEKHLKKIDQESINRTSGYFLTVRTIDNRLGTLILQPLEKLLTEMGSWLVSSSSVKYRNQRTFLTF